VVCQGEVCLPFVTFCKDNFWRIIVASWSPKRRVRDEKLLLRLVTDTFFNTPDAATGTLPACF